MRDDMGAVLLDAAMKRLDAMVKGESADIGNSVVKHGYVAGLVAAQLVLDAVWKDAVRREQINEQKETITMKNEKFGIWHDAANDLPENYDQVLCVKELKNGTRNICLGAFYSDRVEMLGNGWVTSGGSNNVIYWMPLPEIPEKQSE